MGIEGRFLRVFLGFLEGNMELILRVEWGDWSGDDGRVDDEGCLDVFLFMIGTVIS